MRNSRKPLLFIVLSLVFALLFLFFAIKFVEAIVDRNKPSQSQTDPYSAPTNSAVEELGNSVTYNGKKYHINRSITTLLLLGIDNTVANTGAEIGGGGRSDAMILLVLDDEKQTVQNLTISRDTMVNVDIYNKAGRFVASGESHINMQYDYGDSPKRSCYLTKKAVSNLLYGKSIDGCLSITMDGIKPIVDGMGGLALTFEEDYSYIDSRYTKGATVTLNGTEAEAFVRYRDTKSSGSAELRRERHAWFIGELFRKLRSMGGESFINDMLEKAADYIENDIDAASIKKLSQYRFNENQLSLPGKLNPGDDHDEFFVDQEALKAMVIELFYTPETD